MDDDELAERELELREERRKQGIPEPPSRPPVQVWSTEVSYLAASLDRLAEMIATLIVTSGGKPPRVKPVPRPQTAVDRATARRSRQRHNALVAEVEAARNRESKV